MRVTVTMKTVIHTYYGGNIMDRKTRIGIIGCGGISHAHMGGYKAIPELVEVVACCDLDGEKAKNYAADLLLRFARLVMCFLIFP